MLSQNQRLRSVYTKTVAAIMITERFNSVGTNKNTAAKRVKRI